MNSQLASAQKRKMQRHRQYRTRAHTHTHIELYTSSSGALSAEDNRCPCRRTAVLPQQPEVWAAGQKFIWLLKLFKTRTIKDKSVSLIKICSDSSRFQLWKRLIFSRPKVHWLCKAAGLDRSEVSEFLRIRLEKAHTRVVYNRHCLRRAMLQQCFICIFRKLLQISWRLQAIKDKTFPLFPDGFGKEDINVTLHPCSACVTVSRPLQFVSVWSDSDWDVLMLNNPKICIVSAPHPPAPWLSRAGRLIPARPGPTRPSQLRDFQTQHQPRLLSGLLEQNGFIAGFTAAIGSVISGPLLSQASVTKLISWQTSTHRSMCWHTQQITMTKCGEFRSWHRVFVPSSISV